MRLLHHTLSLLGESTLSSTAREREEIERFRYQVYVDEMRKSLPWANHATRRLSEPIDSLALHFYRRNLFGKVAASVRVHMLGPRHPEQMRALHEVIGHCGLTPLVGASFSWSYMSKLMVARDWRGIGVVPKLLTDVYHYGRRTFGARLLFCHCSPGLVRLYQRIGLRPLGISFEDPHVGTQVAMALFLDDVEHFYRINSFLYAAARRYPADDLLLEKLKFTLKISNPPAARPTPLAAPAPPVASSRSFQMPS